MQKYSEKITAATDCVYLCIDKIYRQVNLQQLEYIVALDKYRHFVLAAEACGVTQPTLSAMIHKLEEELDIKLFNRDRNNITPTAIGEKVIRQANIVLSEARRINEVVSDDMGSIYGDLRIGILPTIAPYLVADFIYYLKKEYPLINLHIEEKANKSLVQDLRLGELDVLITTAPENIDGLLEISVYTERFVAYFSPGCERSRECLIKGTLPLEKMWILKEGHCLPNGGFLNVCQNKDIGNHIYEAGSIETLIRIVDRNGGYTIIPELHIGMLSEAQKNNIQFLRTTPPAQREIILLVKEDFVRERLINAVLDTLKIIIPEQMMDSRHVLHPIKLR